MHHTRAFSTRFKQKLLNRSNLSLFSALRSTVCSTATPSSVPVKNDAQKPVNQRKLLLDGPNLRDFFKNEHLRDQEGIPEEEVIPYLQTTKYGARRKVYFDIYGCQMNVNDTEIIWSILKANNFLKTNDIEDADVVLIVTCAIREGAEAKIWNKLQMLVAMRKKKERLKDGKLKMKIGILGCMAERLKDKILEKEKSVDIIAGPDSYKDLPRLLALTEDNQTAINVMLSLDETYADIMPVRLNENSVTAFVSIMRGCDNMCTYCIVPFTRGKERSRPVESILNEIEQLSEQGVKEVTLLGQNVNSYRDLSQGEKFYMRPTNMAKGFRTVYKTKLGGMRFADLLQRVAEVDPEMRIRFTSPHPKDFPDEVLQIISSKPNICNSLHLPAQSGNSNVLERMRRGYTREAYLELIEHARTILPNVALSSDFICGFCGETEEEFRDTLSLLELVRYNTAYLFPYSMREKTTAHRRYQDDVPQLEKQERLLRMVSVYRPIVESLNRSKIGQLQLVLVEGRSKRSEFHLQGRNDSNIKVIFPAGDVPKGGDGDLEPIKPGDYIVVQINAATSQVLKGIALYHTTITDFYRDDVYGPWRNETVKYSSVM